MQILVSPFDMHGWEDGSKWDLQMTENNLETYSNDTPCFIFHLVYSVH